MTLYRPHPSSRPYSRTSIMMRSRRYFDILDPRPEDVDLDDLARGLDVPRFRNQTSLPISIADHMLRCGRLALALGQPLEVVLAAMVHDAGEAYLGDPPGPVKPLMRFELEPGVIVRFDEVERRVLVAIIEAVIPLLTRDEGLALRETLRGRVVGLCGDKRGVVKEIDEIALRGEALLWMPGAEDWAAGERAGAVEGRAVAWSDIAPALIAPRPVFAVEADHAASTWWMCMSGIRYIHEPDKLMKTLRRGLLGEAE